MPRCVVNPRERRVLLVLSAGYLAGLLLLVFTPIAWTLNRLTVWGYVQLRTLGLEWVLPEHVGWALNVLLFVPLGVLVVLGLRRSWPVALGLSALVSAAIELVQLIPAVGREATWADVISNALGGVIGALLALIWQRRHAVER